jgi:type 1 glutamine amidotransferase
MIWGQNHSHRLFHDGINGFNFMGHEYYMGFDPDLIVQENFKYDEIDLMLARVKEQVKQYFRNPSSIGYG